MLRPDATAATDRRDTEIKPAEGGLTKLLGRKGVVKPPVGHLEDPVVRIGKEWAIPELGDLTDRLGRYGHLGVHNPDCLGGPGLVEDRLDPLRKGVA